MSISVSPQTTNLIQALAQSGKLNVEAYDNLTKLPIKQSYTLSAENPMQETHAVAQKALQKDVASSLPPSLAERLKKEERPLRIEILECSGGQGHKKSADAVESAVRGHFDKMGIDVEFKRKDVGSHMAPDPLGKVTFGKYTMIDFHNYLARHGKTKLIAVLSKIGKFVHKLYFPKSVSFFNERYAKKKTEGETPDLIISAVPMVNGPLLKAVKKTDIPVLVMTTDADNALFSINWPEDKNLAPYKYCIPYNSLEIAEKVNKAVNPKNIRGVGYPVRSEFLKEYSQEEKALFRKELGIDPDKKVVGVMMGGLGGMSTFNYFRAMTAGIKEKSLNDPNTHFTYFCGTNTEMEISLIKKAKNAGFKIDEHFTGEGTKLVHHSGTSVTVVGFTKNVHKHMALANVWVTKPGSSSFNECLCMAVPMLLDNVGDPLPWEALNLDLAETYNFGERITTYTQFLQQLNTILDPKNNLDYHNAMVEYRKDRPMQKEFSKNVVNLTYELLEEAECHKARKIKKLEIAKLKSELEKANSAAKVKSSAWVSIKGACRKIAETTLKIYNIAVAIILSPISLIVVGAKWTLKAIIDYGFFSGFNMDKAVKVKRRQELIKGIRKTRKGEKIKGPHKAKPIEGAETPLYSPVSKRPIDALYITSGSTARTGNAIIYVLGKEYQNYNPKNYDHLLDDGADVVLFNPSANSAQAMAADLKEVIKELKKKNPDQKLMLHGYCIGAHVASSVAADLADKTGESLPVIVDRGYGDGYKVAKKMLFIAKFPFAKNYINKHYNNKTLKKIAKHTGAMLFLSPKDGNDAITHQRLKGKKFRNHTKELRDNHKNGINKTIELQNADHWTPWTYEVHNEVKEFMKDQQIIGADYKKFDEQDTGGFPTKTKAPWLRRILMKPFQ